MKGLVRIIALLLILASLPLTLASCDRKYDEAEVIAAAEKLIKASEELNEIYYGDGIESLYNSAHNVSHYCEADPLALEKYGIKTISELKEKTKKVFSEAHAESMFKGSFQGMFSQSGSATMARYYQKYDDSGNKPVCIMVYSEYEPLMNGEVTYDYSTLKVLGSEDEFVYVSINATVYFEGKTQDHELKIRLYEEDYGWRIASTTFVSYNEYKDRYDELQNR